MPCTGFVDVGDVLTIVVVRCGVHFISCLAGPSIIFLVRSASLSSLGGVWSGAVAVHGSKGQSTPTKPKRPTALIPIQVPAALIHPLFDAACVNPAYILFADCVADSVSLPVAMLFSVIVRSIYGLKAAR